MLRAGALLLRQEYLLEHPLRSLARCSLGVLVCRELVHSLLDAARALLGALPLFRYLSCVFLLVGLFRDRFRCVRCNGLLDRLLLLSRFGRWRRGFRRGDLCSSNVWHWFPNETAALTARG